MYKILLDNLSAQTIKDFIVINDIKIKKSQKKEELINDLLEKFREDENDKNIFINFYRGLSKGGKKDFFLYKLDEDFDRESFINIFSGLALEDEIFVPQDKNIHFRRLPMVSENTYEVKIYQRKSHKERDSEKDRREGNTVLEAYTYKDFRHQIYLRFDLNTLKCIFGIDEDNSIKKDKRIDEITENIKTIFGEDLLYSLKSIECTNEFNIFLNDNSVITKNCLNKLNNTNNSTKYIIDMDSVTTIKNKLNDNSTQIATIKTDFINSDVSNHQVLRLARGQNGLTEELKEGQGAYFYRCNTMNNYNFMKFELNTAKSSFRVLNDHITEEVILDVLSRFI